MSAKHGVHPLNEYRGIETRPTSHRNSESSGLFTYCLKWLFVPFSFWLAKLQEEHKLDFNWKLSSTHNVLEDTTGYFSFNQMKQWMPAQWHWRLPFSCRLGKQILNPPVKCFGRHFHPDIINNKMKTIHASILCPREVPDGNVSNCSFKWSCPTKSHFPISHNLLSSFSVWG